MGFCHGYCKMIGYLIPRRFSRPETSPYKCVNENVNTFLQKNVNTFLSFFPVHGKRLGDHMLLVPSPGPCHPGHPALWQLAQLRYRRTPDNPLRPNKPPSFALLKDLL